MYANCIKIYEIIIPIACVLYKIWNMLFKPMHFTNVVATSVNNYLSTAIFFIDYFFVNHKFLVSPFYNQLYEYLKLKSKGLKIFNYM
jgi:hypothetical protein